MLPLRLLCRRFLFGFVLLNEFLPQFPEGLLLGVSIFDIIARARTGGNIHTATTDVVEQSLRASTFQQFGAKLTQKIFGPVGATSPPRASLCRVRACVYFGCFKALTTEFYFLGLLSRRKVYTLSTTDSLRDVPSKWVTQKQASVV